MKKLLLVLAVVAMASFLLVGCLPGTTPSEGEGEGEGEGEVEVAITFDKEYTNAGGETYISCEDTVIVTFPTPVAVDYVVYVAVKTWDDELDPPAYTYEPKIAASPNADRTVWTVDDFPWSEYDPCAPICLVAIVQHPCCPGEEVALRIVTLDCTAPVLDLFVKFTDCGDECVEDDPCVEEFLGVSMEWSSRTSDDCDTLDCCEDTCSGVNGWSLVVDPDECEGPCDTVTGTGCPVEGVLECACLAYAPDTSEDVCYEIDFSFEDNVGNARTSTWVVCLDTDEVVSFEFKGGSAFPEDDGWYTVYDDCVVPK